MIFLVIFVVVPLIELYFMLEVGEVFGAFNTVFLVVLTAVIGGVMVRQQGFSTMMRMRETAAKGETPALEMIESGVLLLCGVMLLLPGFITDTLGFLLLIPPLRKAFVLWGLKRGNFIRQTHPGTHDAQHWHSDASSSENSHRVIEADDWKKED
ncbi:MAG: FxsA family protein [Gammaproteobacteria bacterium]|nr:FxsA family protein [Gammaproteobacteria bacterium]